MVTGEAAGIAGASFSPKPVDESVKSESLGESSRGRNGGGGSGSLSLDRRRGSSGLGNYSARGGGGGGCSSRGWLRSRASRSRARAGTRARARDGKVNARFVGLVDRLGVPVPLDDAVTGGGTLASEVARDGDVEAGLVGRDRVRVRGIVVPGDQGVSNDRVGAGLDDRNVRHAGVRSPDVDREGHDLASGEGLDVGGVVIELEALAKPDVAGRLVVVRLTRGNLQLSLDIAW